jgi:hypothetical protein
MKFSWRHPCLAVAAPGSIELYQDQVSGLDKVGEGVPVQHVHLLLLQKRVFASKYSAISTERHNTENSKQIFPEKELRGAVPIATFICL